MPFAPCLVSCLVFVVVRRACLFSDGRDLALDHRIDRPDVLSASATGTEILTFFGGVHGILALGLYLPHVVDHRPGVACPST